ncbi:MAG: DNA double-strand break repair nuclease NurA [Chloroflexota bacterium]|nr:DNA double-strand break repair nuclease NurA [Chloroflexota bacterium]MDE2940908.1 DNA double-strand break repair nuclease NurA [Chloroflexota bacterium]MDE3268391.1 DNA double-strand break repair nuclease NurA [Chloroflexota bacterium]
MSLDLHKIAGQIADMAAGLGERRAERDAHLSLALDTLSTAQSDVIEEKRALSRTTFLVAGLRGSLTGRHPSPALPPAYAALAVDGSHIDVDRHLAARCYLINLGTVHIRYGEQPVAELGSEPRLFTDEQDMYLRDPGSGRTQALEGSLLGALRAVEELRTLAALAEQSPDNTPTLALIDGSLILWSLAGQAYQDFVRRALIDDMFLPVMDRLRELARSRPLALAAYVSLPRSADVVNALRLDNRRCPYEAANCDMHCGSLALGQRPCDAIAGVMDRDIFGELLGGGERSDVFATTSSIVERYYGEHEVHFYYLNSGEEIARVEIPAWVADSTELLSLTHAGLIDQCRKGHGYPVAISEAHEQAVVTGGDREEFRVMVEAALGTQRLPVYTSLKDRSKRVKWL